MEYIKCFHTHSYSFIFTEPFESKFQTLWLFSNNTVFFSRKRTYSYIITVYFSKSGNSILLTYLIYSLYSKLQYCLFFPPSSRIMPGIFLAIAPVQSLNLEQLVILCLSWHWRFWHAQIDQIIECFLVWLCQFPNE